ncbi:MAG: MATE family efflux transporter [Alistipes sp.]|nr:MATE family efflux transporter [Alistipes sp.]
MRDGSDMIQGGITGSLLRFTLPMIAGSLLQQCYNIADTLIVGRYVGADALAAVGSSYTLMVFLLSVLIGLSLGSGTVFSLQYGAGRPQAVRRSIYVSMVMTGSFCCLLNVAALVWLGSVLRLMQVPAEVFGIMYGYMRIILFGMAFTFVYNFYAALLRAVGDSVTPLVFLAVSVSLNIALDLMFIVGLDGGIEGAAWATVIAQAAAAAGMVIYVRLRHPDLRLRREDMRLDVKSFKEIVSFSSLTCVQQSVMNLGILLVQGIVNGFGTTVMAAFAAAVKIDSFAYMPVQEFGNAFSTFVAQNFGAGRYDRIRVCVRRAFLLASVFSVVISAAVFLFAEPLMLIFVGSEYADIVAAGVDYLRIEGAFYVGIAILFLWYGYYRAVKMPAMSVVLTVISLGLRVALSYAAAGVDTIGVTGIWWSIPIGWIAADLVGWACYRRGRRLRGDM